MQDIMKRKNTDTGEVLSETRSPPLQTEVGRRRECNTVIKKKEKEIYTEILHMLSRLQVQQPT